MSRSGPFQLAAAIMFFMAAGRASAQERASNTIVEVYWSETQTDLKTERSVTTDNRLSLEPVGTARYDLEILWGWKHSNYPDNRRRDITGAFDEEVPLSSYSKVRVRDASKQSVVVVTNRSYRLIVTIDKGSRDCNADVRYVLNPGQDHFMMLSVASDQFIHFKSIVTHAVKCQLGGMPSS